MAILKSYSINQCNWNNKSKLEERKSHKKREYISTDGMNKALNIFNKIRNIMQALISRILECVYE